MTLAAETAAGGAIWPALLLGLVLLVGNGFFVAAEIALLAARRVRIEELATHGDRRAVLAAASLRELSVTFSGAQLGITATSIGLGAVAEPAVVRLLEPIARAAGVPSGAQHAIAFGVGLALVVFLHMVVGEMAPKNLALARAEAVALRLARPFRIYLVIFRPLIVALNATANGLVRLFRVEPVDELGLVHTPDELLMAVVESRDFGTLTPQDANVLSAALGLSRIDAESAMTPRVDLEALADDAPATEILALASETGFTRFPVFHDDIDDVVGIVHVKDALVADDADLQRMSVADLMRPIPEVPESQTLDRLLLDMRRDRSQAVLVVDEYGGTAGLLTLEDVLEELVGEIEDEFDPEQSDVRPTGPGRWSVPGTLRLFELERLTGLRLPEAESETVSGFVAERLGRLPRPGDEVEQDGWRLRVRSLEGRRAGEVTVTAPSEPPTA